MLAGDEVGRGVQASLYLRALLGGGVKWAPHDTPLGPLHAPPHKLLVDGLLHEDAGARRAALALVEEHALVRLLHGMVHCRESHTLQPKPPPCPQPRVTSVILRQKTPS